MNRRIAAMLTTALTPGEDESEIRERLPWLFAAIYPIQTVFSLMETVLVIAILLADGRADHERPDPIRRSERNTGPASGHSRSNAGECDPRSHPHPVADLHRPELPATNRAKDPAMKLNFEGTADEFDRLIGYGPDTTPAPDDLDDKFEKVIGEFLAIPIENLIDTGEEADDGTISATSKKPRLGGTQRILLLTKWLRSGKTFRQWTRLTDEMLLEAINTVAKAYGVSVSAIGDGKLLEQFFAFLNEHWDEILAIFLKLIGL
jgi:hypothetical protein